MKEKLAVFLAVSLVLLSGCGSPAQSEPPENDPPVSPSQEVPAEPEPEPEPEPEVQTGEEPAAASVVTLETEGIDAARIKRLGCDAATSVAIMEDGDLILWGGNVFYGIGNGRTEEDDDIGPVAPTRHHFPAPIADARSGVVTYAVAEDGELYGWGRNSYDQLGLGQQIVSTPQRLELGFAVRQAVSSGTFSLFLTEDGRVYRSGLDITGFDSLRDYESFVAGYPYTSKEPETGLAMLELPFRCRRVALSAIVQVFLSEEGEVWYQGLLLGDHSYSTPSFYQKAPERIDLPEEIVDIAVTDFNIIALSASGRVYVYGRPLSGASDEETDLLLGEYLYQKRLEDIVSISSGEFIIMAISRDGRAYCWGLDKYGVIDEKNDTGIPASSFELIPEPRDMGYSGVVSGMVGQYNGTVLCEDGTAHIWGNNDIGQIIELQ